MGYLCANFLGLSVLDLGPMYATDRQTSDAHHRLMPPPMGWGHNKSLSAADMPEHVSAVSRPTLSVNNGAATACAVAVGQAIEQAIRNIVFAAG